MAARSTKKPGPSGSRALAATNGGGENGFAFRIPPTAFTLKGFRQWCESDTFPETGNIAFIEKEIFVDMTNERLDSHVKVKTEVVRVLGSLVVEGDLGNLYCDGARVVNEVADLSNDPDACFATWEAFEEGRVRQVPSTTGDGDFTELEGSPDWVMEVISPSSVEKDTERLRPIYHRAGIAEYWLIDARGEEVAFQILLRRPRAFAPAPVLRGGWQRSEVFGRVFRLERQRDRLGHWKYHLKVKP